MRREKEADAEESFDEKKKNLYSPDIARALGSSGQTYQLGCVMLRLLL